MKRSDKSFDFTRFDKKYPTNEECLKKFYKTRWGTGYKCPRCHHNKAWEIAPYKYKCRNCGYQTTVTAGTCLHRTHLSMLQWFKAIYYMSICREQATAVELQKLVEIGSNKTALSVMKKIKPMLYCTSQKKLSCADNKLKDIVEISHETITDDLNNPKYIFIAVETKNGRIGRIQIVECPERKNKEKYLKSFNLFVSQHIDAKADRRKSWKISCPSAKKVSDDFNKWRKGKENTEFGVLCLEYCEMINTYKTAVTLNEILKNIVNDNPPPYDSSLI